MLNVLKFAVAALGGISLLVGAVGMVTLMHIAVAERIAEIGLLTALGATRGAHSHFISDRIHRTVNAGRPDRLDNRHRHCMATERFLSPIFQYISPGTMFLAR
ncbi:MAG: ABC transporter permease [Planctomycetaceae bacterium]